LKNNYHHELREGEKTQTDKKSTCFVSQIDVVENADEALRKFDHPAPQLVS